MTQTASEIRTERCYPSLYGASRSYLRVLIEAIEHPNDDARQRLAVIAARHGREFLDADDRAKEVAR